MFEPRTSRYRDTTLWVELEGDVMWDPTTGLCLVTSDFHRVLGVVVAARYTPAKAMERWAATGSAKEWPETLAASTRLIEQWGGQLERQRPKLADWIAEMLERDARFSMEYDRLARRGRLLLLHVWATLLRQPRWWRNHVPGEPWPYELHPGTTMW